MPRPQAKSFHAPDEVRTFGDGRIEIVSLDDTTVGRFVFQPGWRWSKDVAPITGTRSCPHRHVGYTISGTLEVRMDDGTSLIIRAGEAASSGVTLTPTGNYRPAHEPLWFDEAYTALTAMRPPGEIFAVLRDEGDAPLYFLLLHAWTVCFGDGVFALRALSALVGAATVPAVYVVGTRLFSRRAGLLGAALAVVSPLHVHYSQEVRMYALLPPLTLGVVYGLRALLVTPGAFGVGLFAAAATAGLYVHYYFLFLLPLAGLAVVVPERRRVLPLAALAVGLVGLGFLPWLPIFLRQSASGVQDWVVVWWQTQPFWYAIPWSLESLGPGAQYPPMVSFKFRSSVLAHVISLLLAATVLGGGVAAMRRRIEHSERVGWALTLGAVLVPLLLAFAVSLVRSPIYVVGRHDMIAWGPYYVLAGAVLAWFTTWATRWPTRAIATVWLAPSVSTLVPYYGTTRRKWNYADTGDIAARRIIERGRPGDLVVFTAATRTIAEYYLREVRGRFRLESYPLVNDTHMGWVDGRIEDADYARAATAEFLASPQAAAPPETVWLVGPGSHGTAPLLAELERLGYARDAARSSLPVLLCRRRR